MPKISEERKAERRQQILDGARRSFAEHGYEGATVARLEAAIGLSRGAIFNYFASKEAALLHDFNETTSALLADLRKRAATQPIWTRSATPASRCTSTSGSTSR